MSILGSTPQPSATATTHEPPVPLLGPSTPIAVSVATEFSPVPKLGNQLQQFELLGFKKAPYKDSQDRPQISYKIFVLGDLDIESQYVENYGRGQATMTVTEQVFNKLSMYGVNPRKSVVPLIFEVKMLTGSNNNMKISVVDVHISPYQKELLDKNIQPDSVDPPVKN